MAQQIYYRAVQVDGLSLFYREAGPGFGHSDWPDPEQFAYTFDHIGSVDFIKKQK
jgi:hypothetical protein